MDLSSMFSARRVAGRPVVSSASLAGGVAIVTGFLVTTACGSSTPEPVSAKQSGESAAAPVDPSKPLAPKAVNEGQPISTALVDDFEDGDSQNTSVDQRGGYWYTYADKDGTTIEPAGNFKAAEGGVGGSKFSGRMSGKLGDAKVVYAGIGVSFTEPKAPYDASSCSGVSFQGKKTGEGVTNVRLKVGDWQTSPEGGLCQQCYNDFGGQFTFTDEWAEYTLHFSEMKQEPYWGEPKAAIDTKALYQLQWQVNAPGSEFDIQIDDVKLLGCGK